ncbi:unnamed protein product [Ranitomeya imitator]|uniref:V-SNARE coiled-coil homology domain-containing protein n=1 Tax=Ranitomeya imitator TaxID=111125 RepID=A0ABN9KVZ3_9NEOB|nr:unnamed protein product [Ranitomeya imitator]
MSNDPAVRSWSCSYYLASKKGWRPGRLSLTATHLRLRLDGAEHCALSLPLSCISEMKKESSSYIFSAITVLARGGDKHWFSSLAPSRNAVFTVLEHFWREQLLSPRGEQGTPNNSRGAELIAIMSGSQRLLEDTTRVLHHQGEQLGNIMSGLSKIEGDMATADRMLSVLESPSWWPFSRNPWRRTTSKEAAASAQSRGKEGVIAVIPAVFCRHPPDVTLRPGHLTLLLSAMEICDCDLRPVQRYERQDVDDIRVVSGHEMRVRQRFIGRPDVTCSVLSARLPDVLPLLELQYKSKVEVLEEAAVVRDKGRASPGSRSPGWQTGN